MGLFKHIYKWIKFFLSKNSAPVLNIGIPKYIMQILTDIKEEINSNTIIVGEFNIPLTPIYRPSRQKNQQGNSDLKWHT